MDFKDSRAAVHCIYSKVKLIRKKIMLSSHYRWPMFPQTINAMYQFYENEIGKQRNYEVSQ